MNMLVDEPGAVTPIFMPFRSAGPLYFAAFSFDMPSTMPAYLPCSTRRLDVLALGLLRDRVLEGARHDIDAAADDRLQGARAAGKVEDLDVEAFGLEVAVALGDRQRQVVEQRLAADADLELRLFERLRGYRGDDREHERSQYEQTTHGTSPWKMCGARNYPQKRRIRRRSLVNFGSAGGASRTTGGRSRVTTARHPQHGDARASHTKPPLSSPYSAYFAPRRRQHAAHPRSCFPATTTAIATSSCARPSPCSSALPLAPRPIATCAASWSSSAAAIAGRAGIGRRSCFRACGRSTASCGSRVFCSRCCRPPARSVSPRSSRGSSRPTSPGSRARSSRCGSCPASCPRSSRIRCSTPIAATSWRAPSAAPAARPTPWHGCRGARPRP